MFLVYDKDMNLKPFPKGIKPLDIYIPSIGKTRNSSSVAGSNRRIESGSSYTSRPIEVDVGLFAYDTQDYRLLRDVAYDFFSDEYFYVVEKYQRGKRYKVTLPDSYIPDRLNRRVAKLTFNLEPYESYLAESIGTTQIIQQNGINANDELWGYGMGLIADDDSLRYTHGSRTFRIYNAGNVPVHPFEQDLKIKIDEVEGSSRYFELNNITNGTFFRTKEGVTSNQTIIINGPKVSSNGLNYLSKTDYEFIELAPGWNHFSISGATSAEVEFDFRFYYK